MAKQRFVVYRALNKHSTLVGQLLVAGGCHMPFLRYTSWSKCELKMPTSAIMSNSCVRSFSEWKGYAKSKGACRFQKVIYFN